MNNLTPKILEELRELKGWTKTEVSRRLGMKSVSTYANWEYGLRQPDNEMLSKIASLYDVTIDYLITGVKKKSVHDTELTEKDERDIAKRMEKMRKDLLGGNDPDSGLSFHGDPMSEEAIESLLESLELLERQTTRINKKYIPKKYRDNN